jgi:hypothetical protein
MAPVTGDLLARLRAQYCLPGDPIGRAISTEREPNTTSHFHFWCSGEERRLQLGNIIAVVGPDDITFGVIIEMRSITDAQSFLADYLSHDYGRPGIVPPSELTELTVVKCAFLNNISEQARPVGRGAIHFPTAEGLQRAMSLEEHGIPVGIFENGDGTTQPIQLNQNYVIGPEGAHLNIAGISGLASKTSFALFTIRSLLSTNDRTDFPERRNICAVLFNVKSRDLLYIDQPNPMLREQTELATLSRRLYEQCRIAPEPFRDVRFFAPSDPDDPQQPQSHRVNRFDRGGWINVEPICWEYRDIRGYVPTFYDRETFNDQAQSFWESFREHLDQNAIDTWQGFFAELDRIAQSVRPRGQRGPGATLGTWQGSAGVTVLRWNRNFGRLRSVYRGLLAANPAAHRPLQIRSETDRPSVLARGRAIVIDIQRLPENGQRLVFAKVVRDIQNCMEDMEQRRALGLDGVIIFVDELNKFAPAGPGSPLKAQLIDITARGRSSNVSLIGAEQFASEVDKQIFDNSATRVFGRTGSSEITGQVYRRLSNEMRVKLTTLSQGFMLIDNNRFAEPLLARFPLPPCILGDRYVE